MPKQRLYKGTISMIPLPYFRYILLNTNTRHLELNKRFEHLWNLKVAGEYKMRSVFFMYDNLHTGAENYYWLMENAPPCFSELSVDIDIPKVDLKGVLQPAPSLILDIREFLQLISGWYGRAMIYTPDNPLGFQQRTYGQQHERALHAQFQGLDR